MDKKAPFLARAISSVIGFFFGNSKSATEPADTSETPDYYPEENTQDVQDEDVILVDGDDECPETSAELEYYHDRTPTPTPLYRQSEVSPSRRSSPEIPEPSAGTSREPPGHIMDPSDVGLFFHTYSSTDRTEQRAQRLKLQIIRAAYVLARTTPQFRPPLASNAWWETQLSEHPYIGRTLAGFGEVYPAALSAWSYGTFMTKGDEYWKRMIREFPDIIDSINGDGQTKQFCLDLLSQTNKSKTRACSGAVPGHSAYKGRWNLRSMNTTESEVLRHQGSPVPEKPRQSRKRVSGTVSSSDEPYDLTNKRKH